MKNLSPASTEALARKKSKTKKKKSAELAKIRCDNEKNFVNRLWKNGEAC